MTTAGDDRNGCYPSADMQLSSNRVATLTPVLKTRDNSYNKVLPAIRVYGRTRSIVQQREHKNSCGCLLGVAPQERNITDGELLGAYPYEKWMNGAELELLADVRGCADCQKKKAMLHYSCRFGTLHHAADCCFCSPAVEAVKNRAEEGRAYLDFPVNQTRIYPEYRRNPSELEKIKATVDVVKNDANTQITEIDITGYASPEGRYASNARLAQGRAEALKKYVMDSYGFKSDLFRVNSVAEDWDGLRDYVAKSNLPRKDEILFIIDKDENDLDLKEGRIKALDGGKILCFTVAGLLSGLASFGLHGALCGARIQCRRSKTNHKDTSSAVELAGNVSGGSDLCQRQ